MKYTIEELVECFANEEIEKMEAIRDHLKAQLPAKQLKFGVEL